MIDNNIEVYYENDILELEGIDYAREHLWNVYENNEINVPRVTHIIKTCTDQSGLIEWAAKVGYKKQEYYRNKATDIGTAVHELIDRYLLWYVSPDSYHTEFKVDYYEYPDDQRESIFNALENFKYFCDKLKANGTPIERVLFLEEIVTCPWFGGTVDAIITINGANYLVDFKTSKSISPEYLIQASAYMWAINNGYASHIPHIDGIGIIRVSKQSLNTVEELFYNDFNPMHNKIIRNYQDCFLAYVNAYYRTISTNYITNNYYKSYIPYKPFMEIINEN